MIILGNKVADWNASKTGFTAEKVTCKATFLAGRVKGEGVWVMDRHPSEMEKVTEMKITLGTGNECSITTDGKKTPCPIRWNRLKCDSSQV